MQKQQGEAIIGGKHWLVLIRPPVAGFESTGDTRMFKCEEGIMKQVGVNLVVPSGLPFTSVNIEGSKSVKNNIEDTISDWAFDKTVKICTGTGLPGLKPNAMETDELRSYIHNYRDTLQQQESLIHAPYHRQCQSKQIKMPDFSMPRNFKQPSIDLQSYKNLEMPQSHTDNLRSLERKFMKNESQQLRYIENLSNIKPQANIQHDYGLYNRIDFRALETKVMKDIEDISRNSIITNPDIYDKYVQPTQPKVIQQHFNPIDKSFTNLPSPTTVRRDYNFYKQIPKYEPVKMHRYEPARMPEFRPIQMPRYESMPRYEPPRIEPVRMPSMPQMPSMPMRLPSFNR